MLFHIRIYNWIHPSVFFSRPVRIRRAGNELKAVRFLKKLTDQPLSREPEEQMWKLQGKDGVPRHTAHPAVAQTHTRSCLPAEPPPPHRYHPECPPSRELIRGELRSSRSSPDEGASRPRAAQILPSFVSPAGEDQCSESGRLLGPLCSTVMLVCGADR